ncbi:MAG TPA: 2-C-methyl-D-erythritol 4-phosphate cytidylyltransferase [Bacteroidia bacterium]|nr:2-C-methyl-D-erythritol 4-phosphate cytidylyltransferase [Bacteroidia bacterium]
MKKYVIIVAAGSGSRMKSAIPKQFIELHGKPVLMHTIQKFSDTIPDATIIVVIAKEYEQGWKALCSQHAFSISHQLTLGGATRYESVKNGLELVPDAGVVGIHDAARPLVSSETILKVFEEAEVMGNASPAVPLSDSIRRVKGNENIAVDRNQYSVIQTPQCFHSRLIKKAFLKPYQAEFTDDATVLEAFGEKIHLIEGNRENIKITTAQDLIIANALLSKQ